MAYRNEIIGRRTVFFVACRRSDITRTMATASTVVDMAVKW
jgi:hypothetical protein